MWEGIEWNRRNLNRLLRQAVEEFPPRRGLAPVETERELIQIVLEIFMRNCSLMRAQKPTLEQRNDPVHTRQQMLGIGGLMLLDLALVSVAFHIAVSLQAVGHDGAARLDCLADEAMQRGSLGIDDVSPPDATNALPVGLSRYVDQGFVHRLAAS